ncbi:methionine--tRNA ligase, partial [Patescibacteria group bacterium]|nr:methionine--tRNA ligase [Patescibacteria group bacterium]
MDKQKKFYVTTPIYYINDVPHIGHTCTTAIADVMARYRRLKGDDVFFLTGTDEHGQKVAESAEKDGLKIKEYCDKVAPRFEKAWKDLNISFDFFIRTTDVRHKKVVCDLLQKVYDNGDVYKGKYEGLYCIGCEKFLTESDLVDGKCPIHPPEKTKEQSEENWFFKLSKYIPALIKLIENDETNYIFPEGKRAEVLAKLKAGVNDISISRANVKWGIPVPWDKSQTVYVWFDALINYYSATQFVEGKEKFWPADLHILGKEILWFHTVIWQAMLLSAGLMLPKKTYIHSFYMIDGRKMSKSLKNVITPKQLTDLFGVDGTRYLITSSFPAENDSDVGIGRFK